ncbi:unnamed protein product [Polarella glacialis]|uniref:Fibronectin type-III domain-containing protein n=2 Tax=Polarella glacialis TaxID=89957 RepID=A0A813J3E8_POLGL|nr:unnamed protein product [Polarella glacialis]
MADGPGGAKAAALVADPSDEDVSTQVYLGVVKSYNDRRGFGFLACEETADRYGRDVYMPKAEATMAALQAVGVERETAAAMVLSGSASASATAAATAAAASGKSPAKAAAAAAVAAEKEKLDAGSAGEKAPPAPRLAEEDLVLFRVRLSVEGYPQAVCVQRLKKLSGTVQRPTAFPAPGARRSDAAAEGVGLIHSEAAGSLLGSPTVSFQRLACGQAAAGVDGAGGALAAAMTAANAAEAKNISLVKTDRASGSVLGCFTLDLPRTGGEAPSSAPNLQLTCHGFGDKLILAGLPPDLDDTELMRFFSKQGASGTIVAHARACSFASVSFQATADVARLLGRTAHAFADDKDTLIARLLDLAPGTELTATLPALPAPALSAGGYPNEADTLEPGSLLVVWSPLVLAVAYSAELRPAGSNGPWAAVDVASNRLGASSNRFDSNCSSCKVTGLVLNSAYEARISYFTECGTCSEASEASTPCMPAASVNHGASTAGPPIAPMLQAAAPAGYTQTLPAAGFPAAGSGTSPAIFLGPQAGLGAAEGFGSHALNVSMPPPFAAPGDPRHLSFGAPPPQAVAPLGMPPAPPAWPASLLV